MSSHFYILIFSESNGKIESNLDSLDVYSAISLKQHSGEYILFCLVCHQSFYILNGNSSKLCMIAYGHIRISHHYGNLIGELLKELLPIFEKNQQGEKINFNNILFLLDSREKYLTSFTKHLSLSEKLPMLTIFDS